MNRIVFERDGNFDYEIWGFSPNHNMDVCCVKISKPSGGKYSMEICEDCMECLIFTKHLLGEFFTEEEYMFDKQLDQIAQVKDTVPFEKIQNFAKRMTQLMEDNWKTRNFKPNPKEY